ncbi:MAG: NAD(P)H-hydrate dehydratase [Prolixibacteraceae bacterium]|nr:NAD(P)H-hydrate dehydratase [Prolixibacteraceae bacterium]
MKIFSTSQVPEIDKYTIENEPIPDIDLMERAAGKVVRAVLAKKRDVQDIWVFCGPGNNGGDGLAVARMLTGEKNFNIHVFLLKSADVLKNSPKINYERLLSLGNVEVTELSETNLPVVRNKTLIIDALFGSGLNRPLEGFAADVVKHINQSGAYVISIDIPSGLLGENNDGNTTETIIHANETVTFQFPKLSFLFPENEIFTGEWIVTDIGLHPKKISETETPYRLLEKRDIKDKIRKRKNFSHKGTFGHALLISGSYGKMGAAVLASRACLRSGVGLLTTHIPHGGYHIIQTAVPEAMTSIDDSDLMFTSVEPGDTFSAIGIGPGIGVKVNTQRGLHKLITESKVPMVLDADALNILSLNKPWMEQLPGHVVLTPHPGEFDRLEGKSHNGYERLMKAKELAEKHKLVLVLKGAYTAVALPDGNVWFNSTGNPGMATAGSGDVLTGIILSLIAQGYSPADASLIGVFVHGRAGDFAALKKGQVSLIAGDIIKNLGKAFRKLQE